MSGRHRRGDIRDGGRTMPKQETTIMTTATSFDIAQTPFAVSRRTLLLNLAAAGITATALATHLTSNLLVARAEDPLTASLDALLAKSVDGGFPGVALQVEHGGTT